MESMKCEDFRPEMNYISNPLETQKAIKAPNIQYEFDLVERTFFFYLYVFLLRTVSVVTERFHFHRNSPIFQSNFQNNQF